MLTEPQTLDDSSSRYKSLSSQTSAPWNCLWWCQGVGFYAFLTMIHFPPKVMNCVHVLLGNVLSGKGTIRTGSGNNKRKGIVRAGSGKQLDF